MIRTEVDILSDLRWVNERLHDSQEHAEIVRLEERRDRLWNELRGLRAAQGGET